MKPRHLYALIGLVIIGFAGDLWFTASFPVPANAQSVIQGTTPSLSTDSGNPIKIGGVYNTAPPTPANGQRVDAQTDSQGDLKFYMSSAIAGEDITNNVLGTIAKVPIASTYSPTSYQSVGSGSQVVEGNIKATAGNIVSLRASNANAAMRYLWVTNAAGGPANALASSDATVLYVFAIPAGNAIEIGTPFFTSAGKYCSTGISFGFSTSATSFTAGTASDHTLNANYF